QEKVEKILFETEKKTRHDLGREEFLKRVEKFAQNSHDTIVRQMKKMGASVDWSRESYTLDEKRNLAVRTAFKKMYDDGIIYRGHRIVNWDPKLQTTVSDDELERKTEKTDFYYLKYGHFEIGTARPETKFGDKYVVMHPKDKRYKQYEHGQKIELEWINGPITATIIKDEAIDMDFGTGVMTITPWHDAVDFEIAKRHNLDKEQIISYDGKLLDIAGEFSGMDIFEARRKIIEKLKSKGLLARVEENYEHSIAINSRGEGIIEPQIMEQWFIDVNKEFKQKDKKTALKKLIQNAVRSGEIEIIPKRFEKIYFHWIDNLRDWCISRQIWYGHQIPVWYKGKEIYCDVNPPKGDGWKQDPDTLDTWFSSGLWTFSTLGWPNQTEDLKNYHPTSVMETGYDILFFWVARMILMSTYLLNGEVPFKKVYLHGLVRDEKGRKMSKSLGNIIDPLDVAEKYGTDSIRLSLIIGSTPGNDVRLNEEKIGSFRNFTNKIWNISRYIIQKSKIKNQKSKLQLKNKKLTLADYWIISEMGQLIHAVSEDIENFRFSQAGEKLHDFTWDDFAHWYLEASKIEKNENAKNYILVSILKNLLKLWHPFMPFVTEYIWEEIGENKFLMTRGWPRYSEFHILGAQRDTAVHSDNFNFIKETITAIRNARVENKIDTKKKIKVIIDAKNAASGITELITEQKHLIKNLRTGIDELKIKNDGKKVENSIHRTVAGINIYIPAEGLVDIKKEKKKYQKEIENLEKYVANIKTKLKNKNFIKKAPSQVVKQQKENLEKAEAKLAEVRRHSEELK
ncbi:MAG: valine--tRNA ligase, partial [Candidatus Moranbacteria bacterium RIFCSPHIGHO2_12_FULL_40_10]